ncbi:hypothetical protein L7F22_057474 [Adiantum nelumboides]|nr:hypothetical protein [Adiantum nelumboides]
MPFVLTFATTCWVPCCSNCCCQTSRTQAEMASPEGLQGGLFDVIILGASGFTGKFVLRELLQCWSRGQQAPPSILCGSFSDAKHLISKWPRFSLALAGRSVAKLKKSLAWAVETKTHDECFPAEIPESELHKIGLIEADALDEAAMDAVCSRTRVLVNCVGPCLLYGEKIVAACVKAGVHYLDISGEAEFMERMEVKYGERALESGALVVPACGAVSAVSDLGLLFHLRQWSSLLAKDILGSMATLLACQLKMTLISTSSNDSPLQVGPKVIARIRRVLHDGCGGRDKSGRARGCISHHRHQHWAKRHDVPACPLVEYSPLPLHLEAHTCKTAWKVEGLVLKG